MILEHTAFNVSDPEATAAWYCRNLGLRVVRHIPERAQTHFLTDERGGMLEIYCNPPEQVPDYRSMDPLLFHLAFVSTDPDNDRARLQAAGATVHSEVHGDDGSHLVMMRDPWGLAFQLCRRGRPFST